jgi:hypothetical protein
MATLTARQVMAVDSPQVNDTRCMFADWIELLALTSSRRVASRADIVRLVAKQSDGDHGVEEDPDTGEELETEILETQSSVLADNVVDELDFRAKALGESYPFVLSARTEAWKLELKAEALETATHRVYIFCLLVSTLRDGRLISKPIKDEAKEDFAQLFQTVAYLAATQLMGNGGLSFGSPRPDRSTFLEAIKQFTTSFGIGEPRSSFLASSSHKEKDEGIDVIAWRSFADGRPGQVLLLGQVASGNDWLDKPVHTAVGRFLDWFVTHPSKFYLPAIFIPFVQHHGFEPLKSVAYEPAVRDYCRRKEIDFGLVVDRLRIVELITVAQNATLVESLKAVDSWSHVALQHARRAT